MRKPPTRTYYIVVTHRRQFSKVKRLDFFAKADCDAAIAGHFDDALREYFAIRAENLSEAFSKARDKAKKPYKCSSSPSQLTRDEYEAETAKLSAIW